MHQTDLVQARGLSCSLWIDLQKFPMPSADSASDLGLSDQQLAFSQALVLGDRYPDTYTTLFFSYCSVRIPFYIPTTFAKVIAAKYTYQVMETGVEDQFEPTTYVHFNSHAYRTLTPHAVVVSLPHDHFNGERVIVHRSLTTRLFKVQYRARDELAYPLFLRLARLHTHSHAILVSNAKLRDLLHISP